MGLSFNNRAENGAGFKIKQTTPIDDRFVLDSVENLTDGTLISPYTGLVVNIKGTGNLYVLTKLDIDTGKHTWSKIKGASETDASIEGIQAQLNTINTNLEGKIKGVQDQITTLDTNHKADIQGVQGQISQVKKDLLGSGELEDTLDTISEIGSWIKGHQAEYNSIVELQSKGVQGVQSQFTSITDEIKKDVTSLQETSATKTELKTVSDKVDTLTTTIADDKTDLEGKISGAQTRIGELETKHGNEIKGVQGQITTLSNKSAELETKINEHSRQILSLQSNHDTDIQSVQGQINSLSKTVSSNNNILNTKITGVQAKITDIEDKHNDEIKGVQGQITDSEKYDSAAQDNWKTVEVGGVKKDTTKASFEGKTISEVLDMILYPTLYPSVPAGKPSVTLSLGGNTSLYKVGATIPSTTSFTTTTDRGTLAYNTEAGNRYYAGAAGTPSYTISKGSFGGKFEEGTYTVTSSVTFAAGSQPLNNKGTKDGVTMTKYAGGTVKAAQTMYGLYPIYISETSFTNLTEKGLQNYLTGEIKFTGISSPVETTSLNDKFTIAIPSYLTLKSVCTFNNSSGKYDINFMPTVKSTATYNGIEYTVYKRTGDTNDVKQPDKWEIIINKKS